jgi:hypothetical protein
MKNKSISLSDNQKSYITKLINFKMKPLKNKYVLIFLNIETTTSLRTYKCFEM